MTNRQRLPRSVAIVGVLLVAGGLLAACGGDDDEPSGQADSTTTTTATTTPAVVNSPCSTGGLSPTTPTEADLPAAVEAMRADIVAAAAGCDYDALRPLVDRHGTGVRHTFGEPSDPVAAWQAAEDSMQGAPMRALRLLLGLPHGTQTLAPDEVQYVWPAAFAVDQPTDAQLQEVAETGLYSMATLRQWVASGTNYLGYRVLITAEGDWTAFVAGD